MRSESCPRHLVVVLITTVALLLVVGALEAQDNLLVDPSFDDPTLASWPPDYVVQATWQWDPLDRGGSPTSGSGRFENMYVGATFTVTAKQCVNGLVSGQAFDAGVYVFFPTGQAATGYGWVQLVFYAGPDCGGTHVVTLSTSYVTQESPGVWHLSGTTLPAVPDGASSVRFVISSHKASTGGSLVIHFDDAFLFLGGLFSDGFESGDTSAWSATVP
jgi:hypothetical protein